MIRLLPLAWLLLGTAVAIAVGKAIHRADTVAANRRRYTAEAVHEARARLVSPQPTIRLDGHVDRATAIRVIHGAQTGVRR